MIAVAMAEANDDLRAAQPALLSLHKALLDAERAQVESVHGAMSGAEFLQLVSDPIRYGWLKPFSRLIVAIDDTLNPREDAEVVPPGELLDQAPRARATAEGGHALRPALPVAASEGPGARHGALGSGEGARPVGVAVAIGRATVNRQPPFASSTDRVPPCASISPFAIASPRPVERPPSPVPA